MPVTGVLDDLGQIGALGDPRTQVGPLARTVGDVALLLAVLAGPDGHDGGTPPVPLGRPAAVDLRGLRVAASSENGFASPTAETVTTVSRAAEALRETGAAVSDARHPGGGHELTIEVWRSYGEGVCAGELYGILRRWDAFRGDMLRWGERFDVIVCPVFAVPAPRHGETAVPGELDPTSYTTPSSLTGWPSATVRCGMSPESLPLDVQVIAKPGRDAVALAVALELERALGGWEAPPL